MFLQCTGYCMYIIYVNSIVSDVCNVQYSIVKTVCQ